jgi:hypothetical protein
MTWPQSVDCYTAFCDARDYPPALAIAGDWCFSVWVLGNNYRSKHGYHGEYPPGYLPRIATLFPDKRRVLLLFSGKVDLAALPGDTCDLRRDLCPTFVADAHTLEGVPLEQYDLVVADPPYSGEDAEHYGSPMIDRNRVMRALKGVSPGSHIVWLDQVYRSAAFVQEAVIGVQRSTNHRFRCIVIFHRREAGKG